MSFPSTPSAYGAHPAQDPVYQDLAAGEPTTKPVPGRRCPSCLEKGDTVWVIPGKNCPVCGTPVT